jgi:hypothetical protein
MNVQVELANIVEGVQIDAIQAVFKRFDDSWPHGPAAAIWPMHKTQPRDNLGISLQENKAVIRGAVIHDNPSSRQNRL